MNIPIKKSCFYSAVIIILSQLSISLFTRNFQLSVAVIFLSAMSFLIQDFPLIPVTVLSAVGVCSLRMLLAWIVTDTTAPISRYFPEMTFYLCYGFLLYIYVKNITSWKSSGKSFFRRLTQRKDMDTTAFSEYPNRNHTLLVLTVIDYMANFLELLVRLDISAFHIRLQTGIFLTAFFRSCVVWLILTLFAKYRMLLLQKEHEERYQRLVLLISKLNGEMVWMQKNTLLIEETMNHSYKLYQELTEADVPAELSTSALATARDIHEIKKEYLLIMRGISEALNEEVEQDGMYLEEIFTLLKTSMFTLADSMDKTLNFKFICKTNFYTSKHYELLSIFRNLLINALEAAQEQTVTLMISIFPQDEAVIFKITDDGPGIPVEYKDEIFNTGFSTKINFETGEVSRGIGLGLVKDLVEKRLGGSIELASVPGNTTFTVSIPKNQIEVIKS